ncbi:flagellar biosynthesis anti-sigma factor FlgM [Sulfurimonas sp.]
MILNINNTGVNVAYTSNSKSTFIKENMNSANTDKDNSGKVDRLKESIDSGEYKVNLSALANKMADELL